MVVRQLRCELPAPGQPALREAVNKQDGPTPNVAGLNAMELHAASAGDSLTFHRTLPREGAVPRDASYIRDALRDDARIAAAKMDGCNARWIERLSQQNRANETSR